VVRNFRAEGIVTSANFVKRIATGAMPHPSVAFWKKVA
jgi:hypothetical protein